MNSQDKRIESKSIPRKAMQQSKYRIIGLVGQGQFGRVFCASVRPTPGKEITATLKLVALKELSHQRAPTSEFLRELWFLITLQHPNIVPCRALEHTMNGRYLVMDYCEGGTLRDLLEQQRPMRLKESIHLMIGVLMGLQYAHERGVIHCDIKPENILLSLSSAGWLPRLSDFGVARRLPESGNTVQKQEISPDATIGSPAYMAPERFYGLFSPMSDIYGVGVLFYEMLLGDRPFHGTPGDLMWSHLNQRFQIPDIVPEALQRIIRKSLEKLPARRFSSAVVMAEALRQAMEDEQVQQMADHIIPLVHPPEPEHPPEYQIIPEFPPTTYSLPLIPSQTPPKPLLISSPTYLYCATGQQLSLWCQPGQNPLLGEIPSLVTVPQAIRGLIPIPEGCYILTHQHIYWLGKEATKLKKPLWDAETELIHLYSELPEIIPPLSGVKSALFKATSLPKNQSLIIAIPGEIRFYKSILSESQDKNPHLSLTRKIILPTKRLPDLIPLNSRHVLAIWLVQKNPQDPPQTVLRIYTRRGTLVGSLRLPMKLNHLQLTAEPYTLLAISQGNPSSLIRLCLYPFHVQRIPLDSVNPCACETSWGYCIAEPQGQIIVFDRQGNQVGNFLGSVTPKTIAPWGENGLAIVTQTGEHSHLHFLRINLEKMGKPTD